jgi:hypothetical protein
MQPSPFLTFQGLSACCFKTALPVDPDLKPLPQHAPSDPAATNNDGSSGAPAVANSGDAGAPLDQVREHRRYDWSEPDRIQDGLFLGSSSAEKAKPQLEAKGVTHILQVNDTAITIAIARTSSRRARVSLARAGDANAHMPSPGGRGAGQIAPGRV